MSKDLVKVEHLKQWFPAGGHGKNKKFVKAVDDVSFTIVDLIHLKKYPLQGKMKMKDTHQK